MIRILFASLLIGAILTTAVRGEIALRSKQELQEDSTHIVVGKVAAVYTHETKDEKFAHTRGVVEIIVDKLEKGSNIAPNSAIYPRFWTQRWIGKTENPPPFGSGHHVPGAGETVRVYLKQKDGGYEALLPNGFEVIESVEKEKRK